ncbi:G subunit of V-type ATPase [Gilbertella persicaria]|uniref:G subunit of V-type ATPase n=1 Tax=Gilbertella persicaria TaxID=101096 RepID=UPI00221FF8DF|nr:G subunit of V-type ATPase [Gilbertella persicaria]KAI8092306.1 G subunit of V-type ATPase [Gilbertella persicaria]
MSTANSQGINTLLDAEREAAKIVQKAKQYRVQRLKDARSEAAKEIEELKAQKNAEYQNFVAQHSGQSDQSLSKVDEETEAKIAEIRAAAKEKKQDAIDKLLKAITNVEAKPHENHRV